MLLPASPPASHWQQPNPSKLLQQSDSRPPNQPSSKLTPPPLLPKELQPTKDAPAENSGKKSITFAGLFNTNRKLTDENKLTKFVVDEGPLTLGSNDLLDVRTKLGFCLIGYIASKFLGLKAIRALSQSWGSSLQQHESCWLIFQFAREEDKQRTLAGGPYFVYGRPPF
ncbi:UNVERIFIED_CONTAM: hypothetical protein Sindi_0102900 [Sesamum indicum]